MLTSLENETPTGSVTSFLLLLLAVDFQYLRIIFLFFSLCLSPMSFTFIDSIFILLLLLISLVFVCTILLLLRSHRYSISVPFTVIHMRGTNRLFIHSFIHSFIRSFIHSFSFQQSKDLQDSIFFLISGRAHMHHFSSWSFGSMLLSAPVFGFPTVYLYLFNSYSRATYPCDPNYWRSMLQNQVGKEE
jgi:hypothetical protein